ncbi:MAG: ferredoxin reductase [Microthrixaceae bacterium]|nr:ferredoxin reductase [Microthrixaceae bacterium]
MTLTAPTGATPRRWRDQAWRLAALVTKPLLPADTLDLISPLRAGADLRGRIVEITPETADAVTVTVRPGAGWRGHVPGQYIRIGIDVDGVRHWRAYSVTSRTHRADGLISFTTKAIPDGLVSTHLVRHARPGTLVMLDQATGDFVMSTPRPAKVLFLTGGSGITPVIGMLRALDADTGTASDATLDDVVVVHHAPTDGESLFTDELEAMEQRHRGLRVVHVRTGTGTPPPEMELNVGRLDDLCTDWRDRETWTCGPRPMVEAVESLWSGPDHATTRALHVERFTPSIPDGLPEVEGTLTFRAAGVSVPSDGTRTVLDAAEDAGLSPLAGCRMGVCRRCVVPLHSGTVVDRRDGRIECEPGAHVQICVTAAVGDVEIEI